MRERVRSLDGLRALAVVAVMLYHADIGGAAGGYLGVDLFFVLSGYLITSLLLAELANSGTVDLRAFYARRARRLLPGALVLMAALTVVTGLVVTDAAAGLREDVPWVAAFALNWHYIAADHSYFATMARPPLLQHLWSLAIEEQFYLLWPALLIGLTRLRSSRYTVRHLVLVVASGGAALSALQMSRVADALGIPVDSDPARVYFGSDTHAFGLLAGCALAALWSPTTTAASTSPRRSDLLHLAGIGSLLLTLGFLMFVPGTAPVLYHGGFIGFSLVSVALVAVATHPDLASRSGLTLPRLLSRRVAVWVGERSYGMYLWHWPVFTLLRPGVDTGLPDAAVQAARFALVIVVSAASYRVIELPIRSGTLRLPARSPRDWPPRTLAAFTMAGVLLLSGVSGVLRAPGPEAVSLASVGTATSITDDMGEDATPQSAKDTRRRAYHRTVVFGDSVVLSGRQALRDVLGDIAIDAAVGRQPSEIARRITLRRGKGKLGDDVVIHMGTNGVVTRNDLKPILDLLADRHRVVVVNVRVPRTWMTPSNQVIDQLVAHYPNVRLADWSTVGRGHRPYFTPDGVHLTARGSRVFARMVRAALRQP